MPSSSSIQSGQKPRNGFPSLFKRKHQTPRTPPNSGASQTNQESPESAIPESSDRQRTKARYLAAIKALEETVKGHENQWGFYDFPELRGELEDFNTSQLRDKVNEVLEARECLVKDRDRDRDAWEQFKHVAECCFTTFTPFATNFLTITRQGSSVRVGLLYCSYDDRSRF